MGLAGECPAWAGDLRAMGGLGAGDGFIRYVFVQEEYRRSGNLSGILPLSFVCAVCCTRNVVSVPHSCVSCVRGVFIVFVLSTYDT